MSDIQQTYYEAQIREMQDEIAALRESANAWHQAALSAGEHLTAVGPPGYYDMKPEAWRAWAIDAAIEVRSFRGPTDWRDKQPK